MMLRSFGITQSSLCSKLSVPFPFLWLTEPGSDMFIRCSLPVVCGLVKKQGRGAPADRCQFGLWAFCCLSLSKEVSRERKGGARAAEILDRTPPCKGGALPLASKSHCFRPYPPMVLLFPANIYIRSKSLGQAQRRRLSQENHLDLGVLTL